MTWSTSTRKQRLPKDWRTIRQRILERDGNRCTLVEHGERCTARASDVDHVVAGDDHRDSNLRSLCGPHHRRKSSREGRAAQPSRLRPPEPHPGMIR